MKPKLLFLTNIHNGAPDEDQMLTGFLRADFDLIVSHPLDCLNVLCSVDGVVIRNIWPTHEYKNSWDEIKLHLRNSILPIYNPLILKGDVEGKDYLIILYKLGYPVIPSVDQIKDLHLIPDSEFYWIKPKHSCDGIGAERLTKASLIQRNPLGYIIQPFFEFQYEPSFFFIDNRFQNAIWSKHRLLSDDVAPYNLKPDDLAFAEQFVHWADAPYGIQRIDAIRTLDGKLLLTEIENLSPYLYLSELGKDIGTKFMNAFRISLLGVFSTEISGKAIHPPL